MENAPNRDLQTRLARLEELIQELEKIGDEKMRGQVRELVQALLGLHADGLNRALELVYDHSSNGDALIGRLAEDDLVSHLLLLHGLHPLPIETRVQNAIEAVKPRLGQHGGSVQLLGVTPEGVVRLQLEGNCEGCPSSRMTLKFSIEEAIYAAAPDVTGLEVDGLVEEHAPPPPNPMFTECPTPNGSEPQPGVKT